MDSHALAVLEFHKVRDLLAGYSKTSMGRELIERIEPMTDRARIQRQFDLVSEMVTAMEQGHGPSFGGVTDVRMLVRRASIGSMLSAEQLQDVAGVLTATGAFYRYRMRLDARSNRLIELLQPIEDLGAVAKSIAGSIDPRGNVLDMASAELTGIRLRLAAIENQIQEQVKRLLRHAEIRRALQYPNATMVGDHYVLPVAADHRHKVQGVVHRTSPTGETLFIEPAAVAGLSADRAVIKGDEDREIRRVLRQLTAEIARVSKPLTKALDVMAQLDVVAASATFARDYAMTAPKVGGDALVLVAARHPLLEHIFRGQTASEKRSVVPIDVRLGDGYNLLVITGPNTGGKTVTLKTIGLLALMAQAGMHIPAGVGSKVPVFDFVLADIGDEQSLEQSLSTFSSHMSRIADIFRTASAQSLVLLDELGAGTDPNDGAALGRAILDGLDRVGCRAVVTTHLGDLKSYALGNPRAENAAVEFDHATLRPTYRLLVGQIGKSNALEIAKRLKLPKNLLRRAYQYLKRKQRRAPEIAKLAQLRQEMEQARTDAVAARLEAERQREEITKSTEMLALQAREEAAMRSAREQLRVGDPVHVSRFDKEGRVVRVDLKRRVALVAVGIGQWEVPLDEVTPVPTEP